MIRKIKRPIEAIAEQLRVVMQREMTDIIAIGDLLLEAKEHLLERGAWLPWLENNFGSSDRTAENYMNAARFAEEIRNVANLKLRPTTLYMLGREMERPNGLYDRKAIKAILKAAETRWINVDEAEAIAESLQPEPPVEATPAVAPEMTAAEIDETFDSPPDLPLAPESTARDGILPPFDQAVTTLAQLHTKPLASFAASTHQPHKLRTVSVFLQEVADTILQQKAASDQSTNSRIEVDHDLV